MNSLICALMLFSSYDGTVEVEYYPTYSLAEHKATIRAIEKYDMSFTTLEDIKEHTNFLIEEGADVVEMYIKCDYMKE